MYESSSARPRKGIFYFGGGYEDCNRGGTYRTGLGYAHRGGDGADLPDGDVPAPGARAEHGLRLYPVGQSDPAGPGRGDRTAGGGGSRLRLRLGDGRQRQPPSPVQEG